MFADPIIISPGSIIAFYIVVGTALIVETGIVSSLLAFFRGVAPLNLFTGYLITNVSIYLLIFGPYVFVEPSHMLLKEILVVLLDGLAIKLLVGFSVFQGDNYQTVTWWLALIISGIGNIVSYLIGEMANHQHWA